MTYCHHVHMLMGMNKVKVYRSGPVAVPAERGVEAEVFMQSDLLKGDKPQGRTTALYATPTLEAVVRWVKGNFMSNNADAKVHELTVDADEVYVYRVSAWERASWSTYGIGSDKWNALNRAYWESGETLTAHLERYANGYADWRERDDFEVLISESAVLSYRGVSDKRLLASIAEDEQEVRDVKNILRSYRRRVEDDRVYAAAQMARAA